MVSYWLRQHLLSETNTSVVCRDYNQVISYLESVRAYDDRLIY